MSLLTARHRLLRYDTCRTESSTRGIPMPNENKDLVRRAVEDIWNGGNFATIGNYAANDIVVHASSPEEELHGIEEITRYYSELRDAFPDIHFVIEDQIAEGDRVVTRWSATATHTAPFHGIPPTNRTGRITGIDIDRIADGKVVECWPNADELGLMRQLGVIPAPEQVGQPS